MNKLKKLLLISLTLLLSTANNGFASTANGTISASGTVTGTCTVAATNMAFGTLNQGATTTQTSTVTATCSDGVTWTVTNTGSSNNLCVSSCATAANTIGLPLTVVGEAAYHTPGTFISGGSGNLTGISTGSAQTGTITGIAAAASGKTAGNYTATINLLITY